MVWTQNRASKHQADYKASSHAKALPLSAKQTDTRSLAQLWDQRPVKISAPFIAQSKPKKVPIDPIEPRLRRRIVGGREEIDAKIDLHGLTQADAHPV